MIKPGCTTAVFISCETKSNFCAGVHTAGVDDDLSFHGPSLIFICHGDVGFLKLLGLFGESAC
jgi:hypothetical protein